MSAHPSLVVLADAATWTRPRGVARRRAAAVARTSQELTDRRSRAAACSTSAFSCSGSRRLMRAVAASSGSAATGSAGSGGPSSGAGHDDELRIGAAQAHLDGAGRELAGDLGGGGGERFEQHQPDRGLERSAQPLGQRAGVLAPGLGGDRELSAEAIDIRCDIHDAIMTPKWHQVKATMVSWVRRVPRCRLHEKFRRLPQAFGNAVVSLGHDPSAPSPGCVGASARRRRGPRRRRAARLCETPPPSACSV